MKLQKIAKILLIPMLATISLIGTNVEVKATGDKEEIVRNFYEAIINKDVESILNYSDDSRYVSADERKISLEILINNPNELIEKYEILDDENPNDENFKVREYYFNGEIIENNIKTNDEKVILSMSEQQMVKQIEAGNQIPMKKEEEDKINKLINERNKATMGYWNTTLGSRGVVMSKLVSFSNKSGATVQYRQNSSVASPRVQYYLYNIRFTTFDTLLQFTASGNNSTVKNVWTSLDKNKSYSNTRVEVANQNTTKVDVAGNLYIS